MIVPDRETFRKIAKSGALVPVYREILADLETPVAAYIKIATGQPYSFLLESVEKADTIGRYSFLGANPSIIFKSKGRLVTITNRNETQTFESNDPLNALRDLLAVYTPAPVVGLPPFHGGAVGYISYDQVRFMEKLPDKNPDELDVPDLYFMITDTILIFDHVRNKLAVVSNAHVTENGPDDAYDEAVAKIDVLVNTIRQPAVLSKDTAPPMTVDVPMTSNFTREQYYAAVEKAKEYIRAGDIFQVVPSQRFSRPVHASPVSLYRALRSINPSPYMLLIHFPDVCLVGSSPEVMTQVKNGKCMVRPIAGTRPRGATPAEDLALEKDLLSDEKERAEHIMLVDLGRNDVGRVSLPGTVKPTQLMNIERYSHVMHIVSQVEGELKPDADAFDAIRATFPMGTVSGAPKIRAMQIIDELENTRRGIYSGGCGYISFSGDMDTCIAIRTMVIKNGRAYIQAGGGVVYDSDPQREYEETVNKAKALFRAVEFAEKGLEL